MGARPVECARCGARQRVRSSGDRPQRLTQGLLLGRGPVTVCARLPASVQGQASSGATLARVAVALYAGSFDPIHLGHLGVIEHAARTYEQVVVAVVANPEKPAGMFRPEERLRLLTGATAHLPTVRSVQFYGLRGSHGTGAHRPQGARQRALDGGDEPTAGGDTNGVRSRRCSHEDDLVVTHPPARWCRGSEHRPRARTCQRPTSSGGRDGPSCPGQVHGAGSARSVTCGCWRRCRPDRRIGCALGSAVWFAPPRC
jgi:cytidyltransferase-like protein